MNEHAYTESKGKKKVHLWGGKKTKTNPMPAGKNGGEAKMADGRKILLLSHPHSPEVFHRVGEAKKVGGRDAKKPETITNVGGNPRWDGVKSRQTGQYVRGGAGVNGQKQRGGEQGEDIPRMSAAERIFPLKNPMRVGMEPIGNLRGPCKINSGLSTHRTERISRLHSREVAFNGNGLDHGEKIKDVSAA